MGSFLVIGVRVPIGESTTWPGESNLAGKDGPRELGLGKFPLAVFFRLFWGVPFFCREPNGELGLQMGLSDFLLHVTACETLGAPPPVLRFHELFVSRAVKPRPRETNGSESQTSLQTLNV